MGERWIGGTFAFVSPVKAESPEANLARPRGISSSPSAGGLGLSVEREIRVIDRAAFSANSRIRGV